MALLTEILGIVIYGAQALTALWGLYHVIMMWRKLGQCRFSSEEEQNEFMAEVDERLSKGDFDGTLELCNEDSRVMPQLIYLAIANRNLGYKKTLQLIAERFQLDVISELDYRMSWVLTVVKTAPMLGLFGTVGGMMGAFDSLAAGDKIDPASLATNISLALVTTVIGLAVAIPLMVVVNMINVRIKKLEELVGIGISQFQEAYKASLERIQTRRVG